MNDLDSSFFAFAYVGISRSTSGPLTRLIPNDGVYVFDPAYAQPNNPFRDKIDAFYALMRTSTCSGHTNMQ